MPTKVHASGFAAVPYALMDQAPDSYVVHVYAVLHRHGWNSTSGAWMSINTVRQQTGISVSRIRRSLTWLKDNGWVMAVIRPGKTTVFHVRIEPVQGKKRPEPEMTQAKNGLGTEIKNGLGTQIKNGLRTRTHKQEPKQQEETPFSDSLHLSNEKGVQGGEEKSEPKDPLRLKRLPLGEVPLELIACADLLAEFWSVKKGTRSTLVFNRVVKKLLSWTPEERQEALERAIAAGWGDVFQPQPQRPSRGSWAPPEMKHPAAREFRNGRFVDEDGINTNTNPVLEGLF